MSEHKRTQPPINANAARLTIQKSKSLPFTEKYCNNQTTYSHHRDTGLTSSDVVDIRSSLSKSSSLFIPVLLLIALSSAVTAAATDELLFCFCC